MRPEVEQAALKTPRLQYLGRLPYREVGAVVAGAAASLVPKIRDNDRNETGLFPVKLFEIMACGVPAIVSDYPGQADLVRRGRCGLVVPPRRCGCACYSGRRACGQSGYRSSQWDSAVMSSSFTSIRGMRVGL